MYDNIDTWALEFLYINEMLMVILSLESSISIAE